MPAAAVASLTPAITGISGTSVGARGETAVDMGSALSTGKLQAIHVFSIRHIRQRSYEGLKTWMPGTPKRAGHDVSILNSDGEVDLLLRRRHLGILGRVGLGGLRLRRRLG